MVQNLRKAYTSQANPVEVEAEDLNDGKVLSSEEFRPVFEVQGDTTTAFGAGFGLNDTRRNSHGWSDLDLQSAAGSPINCTLRWEVYRDSSKEDLVAYGGKFSSNKLRNAVSNSLRDKILLPAMFSKLAGNDSYLVLAAKARPTSDGDEVSVSNSSTEAGMAYGEIKQ